MGKSSCSIIAFPGTNSETVISVGPETLTSKQFKKIWIKVPVMIVDDKKNIGRISGATEVVAANFSSSAVELLRQAPCSN
jgi:hypothetical protein